MRRKITVIGAGVSGLSSGIFLLEEGYKVHIVAKEFSPNTTSDVAAAHWFPYLCNPKEKVVEWGKFTLNYVKENLVGDKKTGCIGQNTVELFRHPVGKPWWAAAVDKYEILDAKKVPDGYEGGYKIESVLMDSSVYMGWLMDRFKDLGGTMEQKDISTVEDIECDVIVNCSGIGSIKLFNDTEVYPVRGQVVVVSGSDGGDVMADDEDPSAIRYVIPRINDVVIGGTSQANNASLEINDYDTENILTNASNLRTDYQDSVVKSVKVGLRPARSEVRLELEKIGESKFIVHNYGHGGAGYTLSWGCANEVVKIVRGI